MSLVGYFNLIDLMKRDKVHVRVIVKHSLVRVNNE